MKFCVLSTNQASNLRVLSASLWALLTAAGFLYFQSDLLLIAAYFWPLLAVILLGIVALPTAFAWQFRNLSGFAAFWLFLFWGLLFIFALTGSSPGQMPARCSDAALVIIIFLDAALFGRKLYNLAGINDLHPIQRLVLSSLLGLGTLSLLVLLLGSAGLLAFWPMVILLLAIFIVGVGGVRDTLNDIRESARKLAALDRVDLILMATILFALWLSLPSVFLPPIDYDVIEYHAQLPREYVEMGRVAFRPHNAFSGMPQNMEMLTSLVFTLRGIRGWAAAKLLQWLFLPLLLLAVMLLARNYAGKGSSGRKAALAAGIILFLSPLTTILAGLLYVELGMCAYGAAAALLALEVIKGKQNLRNWRYPFTAGIFAGLAAGAKYPGLLFFIAPLAFLLPVFYLTRKPPANKTQFPRWRRASTALVFIALGSAVSFGPWLVKNYMETGNPVYPIWNRAFGVADWDATLEKRFVAAHRAEDNSPAAAAEAVTTIFSGRKLMPLGFVFLGLCFLPAGARVITGEPSRAEPRGKSGQPPPPGLWLLLSWTGIIVILWFFFTHRIERFLYPAQVWAAVLGGLGWMRLSRITGKALALIPLLLFFLLISLAVLLAVYLFPLAGGNGAPTGMALAWGRKPLAAMFPSIRSWNIGEALRRRVPKGRALLLGEAEGYWLPSNVDSAVVFSRHPLEKMLQTCRTPEELATTMRAQGYTEVVISWSELARLHATYYRAWSFTAAEQRLLRAYFEKYTTGIIPVKSWRKWPGGNRELLPFASQDREQYRQRFGKSPPAGSLSPLPAAYLRARPWLAAVSTPKGKAPNRNSRWFDKLWRDFKILLAPDPQGGPPPVGRYPSEILILRQAAEEQENPAPAATGKG